MKARVFGGFATAAVIALLALALPHRGPAPPQRVVHLIDAVDLAGELIASPQDLWILDLRRGDSVGSERIPGAISLEPGDVNAAVVGNLSPIRKLVVYGEREPVVLPEGVKRYPGELYVLVGGWEAWKSAVLTTPDPPVSPTPALIAEFRLRSALHSRFTGAAAAEPVKLAIRPVSTAASGPKKGGGC